MDEKEEGQQMISEARNRESRRVQERKKRALFQINIKKNQHDHRRISTNSQTREYGRQQQQQRRRQQYTTTCTVFGILFMRIMNVRTSSLALANRKRVPFKKGSMLKRTHTHVHTQRTAWKKACQQKQENWVAQQQQIHHEDILCKKSSNNNNNNSNADDDDDDDINEQMYKNWPILWSMEQGMLNRKHVAPSIQAYAANWIMPVCVCGSTRNGKC